MSEPLAAHLAVQLTRAHAGSALPNAPVVPDRVRTPRTVALRTRVAAELRTVARWVEPTQRRACQTS
jgi:hypothetical protein